MKLWKQVLIGLIAGVATGFFLGESAAGLKIFGTIFMSFIKMAMIPLIFFALLSGITSIGDSQHNVLRISVKGFGGYICTAMFAVIIGLISGTIFKPGIGVDLSSIMSSTSQAPTKAPPTVSEFLLGLIPVNPINSMASGDFLQIIIFSIILGIAINAIGAKANPVKEVINAGAQIMFKMIDWVIRLAPIGVFGFMSWMVGTQGLDVLLSLGKLIVAVLSACVFQYFLFGVMILVFARLSPIPFYKKILQVQALAFATSSSKATLPTAMTQLQQRLGVSKGSTNFLMPLGACINMDGTAIYLGICSLFFAQAFGVNLMPVDYAMLILTCTLGSIGAAGIPAGSIIFMGMVLSSVGLPVEGIGILLGIDRVLDMVRTTINITGDSAITLIIDKTEDTLDKKMYHATNV